MTQRRAGTHIPFHPSLRSLAFALLPLLWLPAACEVAPAAPVSDVAFVADPDWPKPFPENWVLGPVTGVAVDSRGHVWVTHAPSMLPPGHLGAEQDPPIAECCVAAPPVMELDREGNVVGWFDGEGDDYIWPDVPHGLFVDHNDFVWIGSRPHHRVLKFTRDGELVMTIGELDVRGDSNDPERLSAPADIWVNPETNEAFIADGYGNRRIVVFDGETGEYLRHWGAYGEVPDDEVPSRPDDASAPPARQFSTVHGLTGSRDGYLYVADRRNNRIQVFRQDGEFVTEAFARRGTLASGSAFDVALSPDPDQTYLYLADGTNHKIWVFRRHDMEVVGEFGRGGRHLGELYRPHMMAVDHDGNVLVGEADNARLQRFLPRPVADR
jgi:hypothetical protein